MSDKLPRITAKEAEKLLGSHRVYRKEGNRMVIPHHQGKTLHPKIVKELFALLN